MKKFKSIKVKKKDIDSTINLFTGPLLLSYARDTISGETEFRKGQAAMAVYMIGAILRSIGLRKFQVNQWDLDYYGVKIEDLRKMMFSIEIGITEK